MRTRLRLLLGAGVLSLLLVGGAATAAADLITGYDIPQSGGAYSDIAANAGGAAGVTASDLDVIGALTGSVYDNHFYQRGWGTAVDLGKYYSLTLTTGVGQALSLSNMTYSLEDLSHSVGTANSTWHVRSSQDGFTSDVDAFTLNNLSGLVVDRNTDLSSLSSVSGSVELRFYATGWSSTSQVVGFANHLPGGAGGGLSDVGQNIRIYGTVAAVPEPGTIGLLGLGVLGLAFARRRRRAAAE